MECTICPISCKATRNKNAGACTATDKLKIAKFSLHQFEEPIISGTCGSGTIFFCGCSLKCVFCQNYEVSRNLLGKEITENELAEIFKQLEGMGAHNINLVNPTHYTKQIIRALEIYKPNIPIVWNTHGYEKVETLKLINDYVDIYLTDLKYFSSAVSMRYSGKSDYFSVAIKATEFMLNNKKTELSKGLLKQGVIVRHLILPLNTNDSIELLTHLSGIFTQDAYLSVMSQYTPFGKLDGFNELQRKITTREYEKVVNAVYELGFKNVFLQEKSSAKEAYIPSWDF